MNIVTVQTLTSAFERLPKTISRPQYDRALVTTGIVHLGPGAFHRGHQAVYTDDILALDPRWGICAVSLRSTGVRDKLAPQDNQYVLMVLGDGDTSYHLIGAITEILVAPECPATVLARMADPAVHIVSLTITEKGYCLTPEGNLDEGHPDIIHDLATPLRPLSAIGYLVHALNMRRAAGIAPFVPLSCDNLAENGQRLQAAVRQFAARLDGDLAQWIDAQVTFPCTMVDSITPATDAAARQKVQEDLGVADAWPIQREPFKQWIIEDNFTGERPPWEKAGALFVADVRPFEEAKLRLLNGTHSALAYLGALAGHVTVAQAMNDAALERYLVMLMETEIQPSLVAPSGLDLRAYSADILTRYRNPNIVYTLGQIAWDGSQKIPFRLLGTLKDNLTDGRPVALLSLAVAAWMKYVQHVSAAHADHNDPLKQDLFAVAARCNGQAGHDVGHFLSLEQMFPGDLKAMPGFATALERAYALLGAADADSVHAALNEEMQCHG